VRRTHNVLLFFLFAVNIIVVFVCNYTLKHKQTTNVDFDFSRTMSNLCHVTILTLSLVLSFTLFMSCYYIDTMILWNSTSTVTKQRFKFRFIFCCCCHSRMLTRPINSKFKISSWSSVYTSRNIFCESSSSSSEFKKPSNCWTAKEKADSEVDCCCWCWPKAPTHQKS